VWIAVAGLPVDKFLTMEDSFERTLWIKIAQEVMAVQSKIDQNRAILIANAVGKMLGGK
jgi:hypothetical protein